MHGLRPSSHRFPFHGCRNIFWQLLLESCKVYKVSPIFLDVHSHITSNILKLRVRQFKSVNFSLISFEFGVLEVLEGLVNNIFCKTKLDSLGDDLPKVHDDHIGV